MRREGNYPEPEKQYVPFQGVGRTLGSGLSSSLASLESSMTSASGSTMSSSAAPTVDGSLPPTSVQLRLGDGTCMVAHFNFQHTVGDIRAFIDASRPGEARTYRVRTVGFPPKQLTDVTKTIEQSGLANSVVIQKF